MRAIPVCLLAALAPIAAAQDAGHGAADGGGRPATVQPPASPHEGPPRDFPLEVKDFAPAGLAGHAISIAVDDQNRIYAADTNRYTVGVKQSRGDHDMEDLELQAESVEDFQDVMRELVREGKFRRDEAPDDASPEFCMHQGLADEVAIYEDLDGDGVADCRRVFAGGFGDWWTGPGADVLFDDGKVYFTDVPDLWLLEDKDGDGEAEPWERTQVAHGLGIVYSFLGHDLHGIVRGNDGRIYFSLGDRSYSVTTREGRHLFGRCGAAFRMNADGSDLEVFATGLRNPQDLAFDAYGDLMTGDNNNDKGDTARILHLVEGADHGWRLSVQRSDSGGTWMREKMWWTTDELAAQLRMTPLATHRSPAQPAWMNRPLYHPIGQGPSGACIYPGAGLTPRYADHFFLTHCAGGGGLIQAFAFAPDGAGSQVVDFHVFLEENRVTGPSDAIFGYDGRMYTTNWGSGWELNADSSLCMVWNPELAKDARVAEVRALFAAGFAQRDLRELQALLGHFDQRVRQRAQTEIVHRGDDGLATLVRAAGDAKAPQLARMHGTWGIGQWHRERHAAPSEAVAQALLALLDDADARAREIAAQDLGDLRVKSAVAPLVARLDDPEPRVRFHSAIALGKLGDRVAEKPLLLVLEKNDDVDLYLRHAAVLGLAMLDDAAFAAAQSAHPSRAVRLGCVLALRRLKSPEAARFLADADAQVVAEAARAIYDNRLVERFADLAAVLDRPTNGVVASADEAEPLLRRAIATSLRLGTQDDARRLLAFAANGTWPEEHRLAALDALETWDDPGPKEGVWFDWWPTTPRATAGAAAEAYRAAQADGLLARIREQSEPLRRRCQLLDNRLLPPKPTPEHLAVIADSNANEFVRLDSLDVLCGRPREDALSGIDAALRNGTRRMKAAARTALVAIDPERAIAELEPALEADSTIERQQAVDALARLLPPSGRFVRVDLPGDGRILSLAEVKVIGPDGTDLALATAGAHATQSSTDWEGPPELAIDGSTEGDHSDHPCVSHTATERDPWWEVDLGRSWPVAEIEVWNRTDHGHAHRLDGAEIALLAPDRSTRWRSSLDPAPEVVARFDLAVPGPASAKAQALLEALARKLESGSLDPSLQLEVVEAASGSGTNRLAAPVERWRAAQPANDPLRDWSESLAGGDVERGAALFRYDMLAECVRCHKVDGLGGTVGPDLTGIALRHDRRYFLQSIVDPQAALAPGFGPTSAMPPLNDRLDRRELRDVVAYLATLVTLPPRVEPTVPPPPESGPAYYSTTGAIARTLGWIAVAWIACIVALLIFLFRRQPKSLPR